jgi:hypothetical protein
MTIYTNLNIFNDNIETIDYNFQDLVTILRM